MFGKLIALLFASRDAAHRAHLATKSYAQHMALGTFYEEIVGLADSLAEMYQGRYGITPIPSAQRGGLGSAAIKTDGDPADVLESHLDALEGMRYEAIDEAETAMQNQVDEIVALYLSTLYKLRNLS